MSAVKLGEQEEVQQVVERLTSRLLSLIHI